MMRVRWTTEASLDLRESSTIQPARPARMRNGGWARHGIRGAVLLTYALTTGCGLVDQEVDQQRDDGAVFDAIVEHSIKPEANRLAPGMSIRVLEQALAICPNRETPLVPEARAGCLNENVLEFFENRLLPSGKLVFDGLVSPAVRQELASVFRRRHQEARLVRVPHIDGLVPVALEEMAQPLTTHSSSRRSDVKFSLPAYSSDGHALVYASYVCGGLCGYGWLFLLEQDGTRWNVVSVHLIWIS